jgi:hypothetical protein
MCEGIALAWSVLPVPLVETYRLSDRTHDRGGEREAQFLYRQWPAYLPVWHEGQLRIARWGVRRRESRSLPCTGWVAQEALASGAWGGYAPEAVEVPATLGLAGGIWFRIRKGIRGVLVRDERGERVAYVLTEPASHYYRIMTRRAWMPVLIGERI